MDNQVWICIDFQHVKPGKGNTVMRTKLKNVTDGRVLERTFQIGFKLEDVRIEHLILAYAPHAFGENVLGTRIGDDVSACSI